MKNLFLLFISLVSLVTTSVAQSNVSTMTGSGATVTNTGSQSMTQTVTLAHRNVSVEVVVTKVSGTVGGKAKLYGSVDGTNYVDLSTVDSLALTNTTTNKYIWVLTSADYKSYKVTVTGTGTMSATIAGKVYTSGSTYTHNALSMKSSYSLTSDTVDNTGTGYVELTTSQYYDKISVQVVVTKLSGTAAGTVTLQGSNDGVNYVTYNSTLSSARTLTVTNQTTNTAVFVITGTPYKYHRLSYTGSGTMSCTLKGYLLPNKY